MNKNLLISVGVMVFLLIIVLVLSRAYAPPPETITGNYYNDYYSNAVNSCELSGDFACDGLMLDASGYLTISMIPKRDLIISELSINSISSSDSKCQATEVMIEMLADEVKEITLFCGQTPYNTLDADISIKYSLKESGISKIQEGKILNLGVVR